MTDPDREPLIIHAEFNNAEFTNEQINEPHEINISKLAEKNLRRPGIYMWLLALSAGISGLLFGYDTGVISSTLIGIRSSLGHPLSTLDKSLITSITALFAFFVSPVCGLLADLCGRKFVILFADLAFFSGALIQAFAPSVLVMIVGRAVVGLAIGAASFVAPLYIAELSPAPFRGSLVIVNNLFVTFGQVIAYVIGWLFVEIDHADTGWRWIVGLGTVPALIQGLIMFGMPETPRWLVMRKRRDEARTTMMKVFHTEANNSSLVDRILEEIETEISNEEEIKRRSITDEISSKRIYWMKKVKKTWSELFHDDTNRRALFIACLLQGLQELCGFNVLMYFSATIFMFVGFESPTFTSLSVAITNFIVTCVSLLIIDRVGRRRILLYSIPLMAMSLLTCSAGFKYMPFSNSVSFFGDTFASRLPTTDSVSHYDVAPLIILISIIIFVSAYAIGLGPVPWLQSELFPLSVRALGSSLGTSVNWGTNFLVGITFLPMIEFLTPTFTFIFYAGICIFGWFGIWRLYPETTGYGLEEVRGLLDES